MDAQRVPESSSQAHGAQIVIEEKSVNPSITNRQVLLRYQTQIFMLSWLVYAAYYFPRNAFSAAKVGILEEGVISRAGPGILDSVYLAAYAVGQFVWGAVAEKYGQRVVIAGGMVMAMVAAVLMGVIPALSLFLPLMIVQGLGQSTGWSALSKNMATFFTISKRGRAMGFFSTSYAFGGLVAVPVMGWVAYTLFDNWRWAFFTGAMVMLVVFLIFLVLQKNRPEDVGLPGIDEDPKKFDDDYVKGHAAAQARELEAPREKFRLSDLLAAARHDPMVLRLGIIYFMIKPARYAILLWGPVLVLDAVPGVDNMTAILVPVTFGLAGVIAPVVIGWISDTVFKARRMPPCVLSLLVLCVALALWQPAASLGSVWVIAVLLGVVGFTAYAADSMVSGVAAIDFGTSKHAAGAAGFINGCGSVGSILGGLLPGLMAATGVFYTFAGTALIAAVLLIPAWNRRPVAV
ncbi:MFS transporter [Kocuria coralli]|uniref:MFS transporter n=2 Tax=Kocuria coralli TaxID=1461025 RepID=A0A5J5KU15_9MICC|nr:MFS transporter [Kocuria coralli]